MSTYFPAFLKLDALSILVVGAGSVATDKVEKLLDFTQNISIIAPELTPALRIMIETHKLTYHDKHYQKGDIQDFGVVIIAVDDLDLQAQIYAESRAYRCLCNAVDSVEYCDFIFPSYIKKESLTVAISTSGDSPAFAKHFKRYLEAKIPDGITSFLAQMKALRTSLPKGKARMTLLDKKAKAFIESFKD